MAEPEQICLMSKVNGQLVKDGQPLPNTKLVRELSYVYKDGFHTDEAITNAEGYFSFPAIFEKKKRFAFLNMFTIAQNIDIIINGERKIIWSGNKNDEEENTEARGKPINLICDLAKSNYEHKYIDDSSFSTLCDWNVTSDSEPTLKFSEDY